MPEQPTPAYLLEEYYGTIWEKDRIASAWQLLALAKRGDETASTALAYVLNDERDKITRLAIVEHLQATKAKWALAALTKAMFDGDGSVRALAAVAVAEYNDASTLAYSLAALLDAVADPVTREPATRAIRMVTGTAPEKIDTSQRKRVQLGEHPRTIWPKHYEGGEPESSDPPAL
jgi:HEAT repeat protein